MKKLTLTLAALVLMVAAISSRADDKAMADKPWFDMKNCDVCKGYAAQPGLVEHLQNEYHNIGNGLAIVSHVDPAFKDGLKKAEANRDAVLAGMKDGKMPNLCSYCTSFLELTKAGAHFEVVPSQFANVTLITSSDAALVAKIQAFGTRTAAEEKKMGEAMMMDKKSK